MSAIKGTLRNHSERELFQVQKRKVCGCLTRQDSKEGVGEGRSW